MFWRQYQRVSPVRHSLSCHTERQSSLSLTYSLLRALPTAAHEYSAHANMHTRTCVRDARMYVACTLYIVPLSARGMEAAVIRKLRALSVVAIFVSVRPSDRPVSPLSTRGRAFPESSGGDHRGIVRTGYPVSSLPRSQCRLENTQTPRAVFIQPPTPQPIWPKIIYLYIY